MNKQQTLGHIRHLLTVLAGGLIVKGKLDESTAQFAVGIIMGIIGFAWSHYAPEKQPEDTSVPIKPLLLAGLLASGLACASVDPSASPVIVRAEQTIAEAANVFDTFLTLENSQRETVKVKLPKVHAFAESLRQRVPDGTNSLPRGIALVLSAERVKETYKHNRTPQNQASLDTALKTLSVALTEARNQISNLNTNQ